MRLVDLADRDALQDFERGRRGDREGAMRTLHGAGAIVQAGDVDLLDAQRLDADAGTDDVGDGVECADFVKMDVVRRLAVDLALSHGNALKDRERVFLYECGKLAVFDQFPDLAVRPAMAVVVTMVMAAIVAVLMLVDLAPMVMVMLLAVRMLVVFVMMMLVAVLLALVAVMVVLPVGMLVLVGMAVLVLVRVRVFVGMRFASAMGMLVRVLMLMPVGMRMRVPVVMIIFFIIIMMVAMPMIVVVVVIMVVVLMAVIVRFVLVVRVRGALVDAEFYAFHFLPLFPVEVHVKIADIELGQFPLQRGGFDAEIDKGADGHIAADAGETIEEEDFHGSGGGGACGQRSESSRRSMAPS